MRTDGFDAVANSYAFNFPTTHECTITDSRHRFALVCARYNDVGIRASADAGHGIRFTVIIECIFKSLAVSRLGIIHRLVCRVAAANHDLGGKLISLAVCPVRELSVVRRGDGDNVTLFIKSVRCSVGQCSAVDGDLIVCIVCESVGVVVKISLAKCAIVQHTLKQIAQICVEISIGTL